MFGQGAPNKVTIRDVADLAGVGIATVSRALNGDAEVAEATRLRVLEACETLGFRRSSLARGLKRGTTDNIGVAIMSRHAPVVLNPFYTEVIGGIEEALEASEKHLLLSSLKRREGLLALAQEGRVDGLLVVGCDVSDGVLAQFRDRNIPVVLVDHAFEGLPSVVSDHWQAGLIAARHLVAGGSRSFAFVTENLDNPNFGQRLDGFRHGLVEAGLTLEDRAVAAGGDAWDGGYFAMERVMERLAGIPEAVFAANDPAAMSAAKALASRGLTIPDDVSLMGVDDIHLAAHHDPPLTTVRVDKVGLGRVGAQLLLARLAGEDVPERTTLPVELVIRSTTWPTLGSER
ncbi:LacI family DNA-binding transcriptional regulator [Guyparkeria sp.]|uniref:LacI family DNA-binding transcriptional regulator n=1 Tax=Guyparkeria sp. TaxID=2035736 RepID=UPI0039704E34